MIKFTHKNFELDFTNQELVWSENNAWLSDSEEDFSFSFPFTILKTPNTKFFFELLNTTPDIEFKGLLLNNSKLSESLLTVLNYNETKAEISIGNLLDSIPMGDKFLKEFNFPTVAFNSIYDHMENLNFTSVNESNSMYCFPQIIRDYNGLTGYNNYSGILNFENGDYSDPGQVVKPFPYLTRLVKHCFEHQGYSVSGSFFENELIKKAFIVSAEEFHYVTADNDVEHLYEEHIVEKYTGNFFYTSLNSTIDKEVLVYKKSIKPFALKHLLISVKIAYPASQEVIHFTCKLFIDGVLLNIPTPTGLYSPNGDLTVDVVYTLSTDEIGKDITLEVHYINEGDIDSISVTKTALNSITYQQNGQLFVDTLSPSVCVNPNFIDINKIVPEITFSELFQKLSSTLGLSTDINGFSVQLDLPKDKTSKSAAVNLYNQSTYLKHTNAKFGDISFGYAIEDDEKFDYPNPKIGFNTQNQKEPFVKSKKYYKDVELDFIPIFRKTMLNQTTGVLNNNNIRFGFYDVQESLNSLDLIKGPEELFDKFQKEIFWLRTKPKQIEFNFIGDQRLFTELKRDSLIYVSNGLYYIISSLEKTQLKEYIIRYTIQATLFTI